MDGQRFNQQLERQLAFIRNSCEAYDRGQHAEGVRIATALRVLFHDTRKQTSLLTHLGARGTPLLSTSGDPPEASARRQPQAWDALAPGGTAKLDRSSKRDMPVDAWWNQPVMLVGGTVYTRCLIALLAADKDGGAHVDEVLPDEYRRLDAGVWEVTKETPDGKVVERLTVPGQQFAHLRQMGYELLNSPELLAVSKS